MDDESRRAHHQWACRQIEEYRNLRPRYELYARVLEEVLARAAKKLAAMSIVKSRPKTVASFAEKIQRKKHKYADPVNQLTDLCGGRVITHTSAEVEAVSRFVEEHFEIDRANSVDVASRLKPTEFGYRSVHYVIQFRRGVFPTDDVPVEIPAELYSVPGSPHPLKAEIQVRTLLEHAWASFSHERVYKGAFRIPEVWERELAGLAAMLEEADRAFTRIQSGLQTYAANYGSYMSPEEMAEEMEILKLVQTCDPANLELAHRLGKLAIAMGDWATAVAVLAEHAESGHIPLVRDLGMALCKLYQDSPQSDEYARGQAYLARACEPAHRDADALASLAGTYKDSDPTAARRLYRQAFHLDPTDPYAVGNYLVAEIQHRRDTRPVPLMAPAIRAAVRRCHDQILVGMNLPWAYYSLGTFYLLLGQPYDSLVAHAKAVQLSSAGWMIDTSLHTLELLDVVKHELPGYEWMRRVMLVGRAARFPDEEALERVRAAARSGAAAIESPVAIVVGGCDARYERQMLGYRDLVLESFKDFSGTVISGGTRAGVARLVGDVQGAYAQAVHAIGYVPRLIPSDTDIDRRYAEIRSTEGQDFSALETLQYWIDLVAAGIRPAEVRVLGIDGGTISAAEYRLALALGAPVAVVEGSGRAAAELLQDRDWKDVAGLVCLPADGPTIGAFLAGGGVRLATDRREAVARAAHETYRSLQADRLAVEDPAMSEWEALLEELKESNRQLADQLVGKLRQIGCSLQRVEGRAAQPITFTEEEVETLARSEHGRWNAERLLAGWIYGPERDVLRKRSPFLAPWQALPEEVKARSRRFIATIPVHLARAGLEIQREG